GDLVNLSTAMISMIENGNRVRLYPLAKELIGLISDSVEREGLLWDDDASTLHCTDFDRGQASSFLFRTEKETRTEETVATVLVREEHIRLECIKAAALVHCPDHVALAKKFE